jgi:hypothetical protein
MSALSAYLENKIADHLLGAVAFTAPTTVYLALYTSAPSETGGGTEVSGGSYARVAITNNAVNWPNAVAGVKSNGVAIVFPTATAGWGAVTHWALFDAATGGNLLFFGALGASTTINNTDILTVPVGDLDLTFE